MATANLRPDADITVGWTETPAGAAFSTIDDAATQPTVPDTADFVDTTANAAVCEVALTTVTVASVSEAKLWVYGQSNGAIGESFDMALYKGATQIATLNVAAGSTDAWRSATYTGSLTQAEVDDLRARFTANTTLGGLQKVSAAYVELTYTAPAAAAAPRLALLGVGS